MKATFRSGLLSILAGSGWGVSPAEKELRYSKSARRYERVSVRHAFGITTERLGRAYESEKARASSKG